MKRALLFVGSAILIFTGCEGNQVSSAISPSSSSSIQSVTPASSPFTSQTSKNINFELTSFTMDYKDTTGGDTQYISESFTGTGIINAVGDEALVKKPYIVLVDIKKVSGGDSDEHSAGARTVIVTNGIGTFTTSDSQFKRNAIRLEKPVYDIKITGFIPFNELPIK